MAAEKEYETLRTEMEQLRSDISAISKTLQDIVGTEGAAGYERIRKSAERVQSQARRTAEAVSDHIEERPLTSLTGAFVLGLLLGILFGRR